MRAQTSLEGTGGVLRALIVMEDEAAVIRRTLPANRPPCRVDCDLLGDALGHRPARDLAGEGVYRGCEAEPSFARSDVADPPLLRRPQGAERLQRPEDDASQDREGVVLALL